MLIGGGMLAQAFCYFQDHPSVVVFASGVSNSRETDRRQFEREKTLLSRVLKEQHDKRLVYFGTCSVADPELASTLYVKHKLNMEGLIKTYSTNHCVFRLPQVIGHGGNKNTIMNWLYGCIHNGQQFDLWSKAYRYIIDIDDVVTIVSYMIGRDTYTNRIINIASHPFSIYDIVHALESVTDLTATYTEIDKGGKYRLDCREAHEVARSQNIRFDDNYLRQIVYKYYGA